MGVYTEIPEVVAVYGGNKTGKTTFARELAKLGAEMHQVYVEIKKPDANKPTSFSQRFETIYENLKMRTEFDVHVPMMIVLDGAHYLLPRHRETLFARLFGAERIFDHLIITSKTPLTTLAKYSPDHHRVVLKPGVYGAENIELAMGQSVEGLEDLLDDSLLIKKGVLPFKITKEGQ